MCICVHMYQRTVVLTCAPVSPLPAPGPGGWWIWIDYDRCQVLVRVYEESGGGGLEGVLSALDYMARAPVRTPPAPHQDQGRVWLLIGPPTNHTFPPVHSFRSQGCQSSRIASVSPWHELGPRNRGTLQSLGLFPRASSIPRSAIIPLQTSFLLSSVLYPLLLNGNGYECQLCPIVGS